MTKRESKLDVQSRAELENRFQALVHDASIGRQQRGLEFEALLHALLDFEGLDPRTRFRPRGEEIDGSFEWHGRYFLLEAKWHQNPLPASDLYSFKGKVDGKIAGTVGIFLSCSNYSAEVSDALRFGKEVNLVLFDMDDVTEVFNGSISFTDALRRKLRVAAEQTPYYSLQKKRVEPEGIGRPYSLVVADTKENMGIARLVASSFDIQRIVDFKSSGGPLNLLATARAAIDEELSHEYGQVIFVVDNDSSLDVDEEPINGQFIYANGNSIQVVVIHLPGPDACDNDLLDLLRGGRRRYIRATDITLDAGQLVRTIPELSRFLDVLGARRHRYKRDPAAGFGMPPGMEI